MARIGPAVRSLACAWLATLLSVALFALLLQPPRWSGAGGQMIAVSLLDEREAGTLDAPQLAEPAAPAKADPLIGDGAQRDRAAAVAGAITAYLPASQLTERPQVLRDIDSEWRLPGVRLPVLACTLLISEYGDVDNVLLDEQPLAPMLEEDIRARFLAARFSPGKLHGKPVRSALRIEVRLD